MVLFNLRYLVFALNSYYSAVGVLDFSLNCLGDALLELDFCLNLVGNQTHIQRAELFGVVHSN